ncbi:MAG: hypothetical protein JNJ54_30500 [Myxococcaceae bacterium]|nr:hypothetical protein [Myxococcaceae bacterium]
MSGGAPTPGDALCRAQPLVKGIAGEGHRVSGVAPSPGEALCRAQPVVKSIE